MTRRRIEQCRGDRQPVPVPVPLPKEVERIGPREYRDPRSGVVLEIIWNGIGPLPGQTQPSPRKRDPLLNVIGL